MPDVTSTLLAMYQQIIGGSSAREQASLEAECARRVITSGLSIAANGAMTLPGDLTVNNFSVLGSFSVLGTLTVGTLAVTGGASVAGLLTCGTLSSGVTATGPLTVTGSTILNGLLSIGAFGVNTIGGSGPGSAQLILGSTSAGASNFAQVIARSDNANGVLAAWSSTVVSAPYNLPSGVTLSADGPGGLTVLSAHASGAVRFYTNSLERLRIQPTGDVLLGATSLPGPVALGIVADAATVRLPLHIQNSAASNSGNLVAFVNSAGALAGSITQTGATSVVYATSSDARLKDDDGRADDVTALRSVVVHDFTWKADGRRARGVFAQEAQAVFPHAVTEGTNETTDRGGLAHPWMTDYSQFVPDLIVGWQQHDAELAALRRALAAGSGRPRTTGRLADQHADREGGPEDEGEDQGEVRH